MPTLMSKPLMRREVVSLDTTDGRIRRRPATASRRTQAELCAAARRSPNLSCSARTRGVTCTVTCTGSSSHSATCSGEGAEKIEGKPAVESFPTWTPSHSTGMKRPPSSTRNSGHWYSSSLDAHAVTSGSCDSGDHTVSVTLASYRNSRFVPKPLRAASSGARSRASTLSCSVLSRSASMKGMRATASQSCFFPSMSISNSRG
mmetsp:Transcript_45377/g.91028  ORF Transcript_45377/g.91028 Transcript_45377/m.91028 type:complete len:203 (-) Transcript_45377:580-1188(-)